MNTLFDPIALCSKIDPDEDAARLQQVIAQLTAFVHNGPYCHDGNNVCWFCYTGIWDWEPDQRQAGHHPTCEFLTAWLMVNYGEAIKPRLEELS